MTASAVPRTPFDAGDAAMAESYTRRHKLSIVDPFATAAEEDLVFKSSLSAARLIMTNSFATVRADGQALRVYPFIVGRPTTNAFAVEDAGLQLCGLDVGLANAAFEISLFVFSRATLFTEIGEAAEERSPSLPLGSDLAFWFSDRLRQRGTAEGAPVGLELIPKNIERQLAAQFMTQLLLRFVWLHELYHCLNGHTGLLASRKPGTVLNEMPDEKSIEMIEIESGGDAKRHEGLRQAMEYDADRSALWMLVRMQQGDYEPITSAANWPRALRLKLAIFAAAMMTFLFDQAARRQARRPGLTHPTAQYRLVDLVRTLASHLTEPPGEVRQAFHAVLAEMTALQHHLPRFVSASRLMENIHSMVLQRELDEIDDALQTARSAFRPFAYRFNGPL